MIDNDTALLCRSVTRVWTGSRPRVVAAAAALGISLTALIPAAGAQAMVGCPNAGTPIAAASRPELQRAVVCLINQERTRRHLPRLRANRRLDRSAQGWTDAQVKRAGLGHGADFAARISAAGFNWSSVGENIASGFPTPAGVVRAWMASVGHCQNILSPNYADVGTGVSGRAVSGGGPAGTWTQDFGLPTGRSHPSGNWTPANGCPYVL